ncbi:CoA pyrophosphatase [Affinibrenneria salicis]|uniref:CoA pyrophosphatase n=1 Tax=Affinibrenneria salicis TaxID=2590031 RepID=A0A5J5G3Y3_9GAMM|nr:CoA pyrophosphatase [Affinibrenneria salicis]KAA9001761.1 CoA pyrophosphatase [Affinibrenneria salicis]
MPQTPYAAALASRTSASRAAPELSAFIARFQLCRPPPARPARNQRQAAVLVPIVCHPRPTLLLTRRSAHLRKHPGQVAFPGGAADPQDESLIATALREAHEEIALPRRLVEVLGTLPALDSVSGFRVTPVVGLVSPLARFIPNDDEVADLFEMPLCEALTLTRYHPLDIERRRQPQRVYLSWYQQQFVWGMTAAIIRQLALQVGALDQRRVSPAGVRG